MVKKLPEVQETQVWSLGREDPLEKEMATHSSILAWKIPWAEEPGRVQSMGLNWGTFEINTSRKYFYHALKHIFLNYRDFIGGPVIKNPPANVGDTSSISGPGRSSN